jgi:transcriptional regulator with XRE-family HTH domain
MSTFGSRLRAARREARLSQAELGGERYSDSYISHLESGRRTAGPDVLAYLAERLRTTPEALGASGTVEADGSGTAARAVGTADLTARLVVLHLRARESSEHGHHVHARALAEEGRALVGTDHPALQWDFTHLLATTALLLEEYEACAALADELTEHPLAQASVELRVESLALAARALRASGKLRLALERADLAVANSVDLPPASTPRVLAVLARLACVAELGWAEDAQAHGRELSAVRDGVDALHLRGQVAWTLGNLAFLRGDVEAGIAEHDLAATWLGPDHDLRGWGRFCRASSAMRLAAGTTQGVAALLEQAQRAIDLVGNPGDRHELDITRAELLFQEHDAAGALAVLDVTAALDAPLPPHTRAEASWLRHRCLRDLGKTDLARDAARDAALLFEEAGAMDRAVRAWRAHSDHDAQS